MTEMGVECWQQYGRKTCRGAEMQRGRGAEMQRRRGGEVQRGRGAEMQRCRGGEVQTCCSPSRRCVASLRD